MVFKQETSSEDKENKNPESGLDLLGIPFPRKTRRPRDLPHLLCPQVVLLFIISFSWPIGFEKLSIQPSKLWIIDDLCPLCDLCFL